MEVRSINAVSEAASTAMPRPDFSSSTIASDLGGKAVLLLLRPLNCSAPEVTSVNAIGYVNQPPAVALPTQRSWVAMDTRILAKAWANIRYTDLHWGETPCR